MSHSEIIDLEVDDLKTLANTAKRLGGQFMLNQKTYEWYGKYMHDYPLPAGITANDLGKCEHAIKFPEINYEVGIINSRNQKGAYELLWDFWDKPLKAKMGGDKGIAFIQNYTMEKAKVAAMSKGRLCRESKIKTKIGQKLRMVITV